MADQDPEDKIYDPTEKRLKEFRDEGKLAVSKDVMSAAQLMMVIMVFSALGPKLIHDLGALTSWVLSHSHDGALDFATVFRQFVGGVAPTMIGMVVALSVAAVAAGLAQTRFNWAPKALGFKASRINPISRWSQLFSPKKLGTNMGLSALKMAGAGGVIGVILASGLGGYRVLGLTSLQTSWGFVVDHLRGLLFVTTIVIGVLAAIDFLWQKRQNDTQLKMTFDEVKKDNKESEGDPHLKGKRKQMAREMSANAMLDAVPRADVIVVNPTHYAVALAYAPGQDEAPRVVAKGMDAVAASIRAIARSNSIAIIENRPLARALHANVKVGGPVPANLFRAVAEVLAIVWRNRAAKR